MTCCTWYETLSYEPVEGRINSTTCSVLYHIATYQTGTDKSGKTVSAILTTLSNNEKYLYHRCKCDTGQSCIDFIWFYCFLFDIKCYTVT